MTTWKLALSQAVVLFLYPHTSLANSWMILASTVVEEKDSYVQLMQNGAYGWWCNGNGASLWSPTNSDTGIMFAKEFIIFKPKANTLIYECIQWCINEGSPNISSHAKQEHTTSHLISLLIYQAYSGEKIGTKHTSPLQDALASLVDLDSRS